MVDIDMNRHIIIGSDIEDWHQIPVTAPLAVLILIEGPLAKNKNLNCIRELLVAGCRLFFICGQDAPLLETLVDEIIEDHSTNLVLTISFEGFLDEGVEYFLSMAEVEELTFQTRLAFVLAGDSEQKEIGFSRLASALQNFQ
jgi:hypothetical protein